jgi:hypothetical protein
MISYKNVALTVKTNFKTQRFGIPSESLVITMQLKNSSLSSLFLKLVRYSLLILLY